MLQQTERLLADHRIVEQLLATCSRSLSILQTWDGDTHWAFRRWRLVLA
ncbi:hypothetical protein OG819_40375 [Streptomyces sp. NBC_01549]|nr:hypothetical protein [Streptomyces sp. NBC_01549]MCX4595703.1 hypothetical protein [Streptomyces sp. NBC_01549]